MERCPELHVILSQDRAEMCARGTAHAHNNSSPGLHDWERPSMTFDPKNKIFPHFPKYDRRIRATTN